LKVNKLLVNQEATNQLNAGQLCAAFSTTTSQNQTTIFGSHASTETVVANTLKITGLECSFHDKPVKNPELIHTVVRKEGEF